METGGTVKEKLSKWKGELQDIRSEMPSVKSVIKGIELKGFLKSSFFKKW